MWISFWTSLLSWELNVIKFNAVYGDELWNHRTGMPNQKGKRAAPGYIPGRGREMRTRSTQPRTMPLESRERRAPPTRNEWVQLQQGLVLAGQPAGLRNSQLRAPSRPRAGATRPALVLLVARLMLEKQSAWDGSAFGIRHRGLCWLEICAWAIIRRLLV